MSGKTYARLREYCKAHGVSISGFVEAMVRARLDDAEHFPQTDDIAKTAMPYREPRPRPKTKQPTKEEIEKFFPGGVHNF